MTKQLVATEIERIRSAWTNTSNYGCKGIDGTVSYTNCGDPLLSQGVGYSPSLPDFTSVPSERVVESVVAGLETFYKMALMDTSVWARYFRDNKQTELWGRWEDTETAVHNQLFRPHEPIISYNESELYNIEPFEDQFRNSLWGVCTLLLSQAQITLPLLQTHDDMT
eukprot:2004351-Rhodomonas_salina.1